MGGKGRKGNMVRECIYKRNLNGVNHKIVNIPDRHHMLPNKTSSTRNVLQLFD